MNLRLLQLSDSALPIGGYTHSWGLEAALARGIVRDIATLEAWTRSWLRYSLAPLEGVVAASACRAEDAAALAEANELLEVTLAAPSLRTASREMGEQLVLLAASWCWSAGGIARQQTGPGWHHAVAFGLVARLAGADPREAALAFLHQSALGMISAGLRAVPVSHVHGQQLLAYLHDDIEALAGEVANRPLHTAGASGPAYEVLCDEQTRLYTRMFRS